MKQSQFTFLSFILLCLLLIPSAASAQNNAKRKSTDKAPVAAVSKADSIHLQRIIAYQGRTAVGDSMPNSVRTLLNALDHHPYAVHADVRITSDDNLIVCADDNLEGLYIADSPYQLLADHPAFRSNGVALLKEYLSKALRKLSRQGTPTTSILLEIHPTSNGEQNIRLCDQLADLLTCLRDMGAEKCVIITAPEISQCEQLRVRLPYVRILYQGSDVEPDKLSQAGINGLYCDIKAYYQHPEWLDAKLSNFITAVQPVSNEVDQLKLIDMGVQYLATNDFKQLISLFEKRK